MQNLSLLVNHLDRQVFHVTVLSLANKGDKDSDIKLDKDSGIKFRRIDEKRKLDFTSINEIRALIKNCNIDILSCHGYKADVYGFILRKFYRCGVKLVTMSHGWVTPGFKFQAYYFLDKLVMGHFDRIILVAEGLRRQLRGFMIPRKKIVIINNAVDPDDFIEHQNRDVIRQGINLTGQDKVIGFVGRLSQEKNIETILYAVKETLKSGKNIKFLIIGEGPQKERLKRLSEGLGVSNHVIFTGYQKDACRLHGILDLHVSASLKEGLPNSLLEAQAAGTPCIVTDIPGNNDIIRDGVNGFLFRPRDYIALSKKIITLLEDKALAQKFTAEGRKNIKEKFSIQERIKKLESLYSKTMEDF